MIGLRAAREGLGGIETALLHLAPRLALRGIDLTLFGRDAYADGTPPPGVREINLPHLHGKYLETISYAARATHLAKDYDLIHFHAQGPALFSALPRLRGQRVIVTVHGLDWARPKWNRAARMVLKLGEAQALKRAHKLVVVSQALHDHYRGQSRGHLLTIPNGICRDKTSPDPTYLANLGLKAGQYSLFLGRIVADKDCLTLIDAHQRLNSSWPLIFAGPPGHDADYQHRFQRAIEGARGIGWVGSVHGAQKAALLAGAGVFILPSKIEGLSIALLEALGAGLPIIASDIPPNREGAGDGAHYFPPGDSSALAKALEKVMGDEKMRLKLSRQAKTRAQGAFNWDHIADQYARLYFETLGIA